VSFGRFELNPSEIQSEPVWSDLPVIATRNLVLFPNVTIPIALIRNNARKVAKYASEHHISIGVCCQLDPSDEHPDSVKKVFAYGVVADVIQVIDLPGGAQTALVRARDKFKILGEAPGNTLPESELNVVAKPIADRLSSSPDKEFDVLIKSIREACASVVGNAEGGQGLLLTIEHMSDPAELINTVATNLPLEPSDKMKMLAINSIKQRAFKLFQAMQALLDSVEIANNIKERAREEMNQQSRNAFLQQQMNAIREELYGEEGEDVDNLRKKLSQLELPENVAKTVEKEIDKLGRLNPAIPDYSTLLTYLETVLDLPWNVKTPLNEDFAVAEEVLNTDHYGLEKVKDRILEQLAVLMNNPAGKAPILCLVGAPGVGKTSLGQSIARALGRNYQRVSLGGLHDEAEIRGHRRTYIGAMPGRIMDSLRRAKSSNPVILLDEIDKIGADFKGDPSAALLEVLDPEQNCRFHDNYIDVDFDLSNVLFIATANTLSTLSQPLLDRMEIIEISGYLVEEKMEIARRHLLPRVLSQHNLDSGDLQVSDDALRAIIEQYTSESGV
ncbi:MAG: AAA family ATPase, partial [Muribaculaceae bacterium]|nr:AAA family ATPase [Muribaculaceae bacterium]